MYYCDDGSLWTIVTVATIISRGTPIISLVDISITSRNIFTTSVISATYAASRYKYGLQCMSNLVFLKGQCVSVESPCNHDDFTGSEIIMKLKVYMVLQYTW